ncbi:DUF1737 domain-containing protein [Tenacibaculum dicentrarchi]|nr:DUF1737 domain-containing protein [Tenacibaculum dicentrarchi]MCD8408589.1 DUF1737 domain-containing protein [Tenacibaculum dicentrarchi]MCD8425990.1 DUF1737 domain-containing protein [Tenacibaculum dicentrarchi]MCD8436033.1 DUF1737 domain-containing protein [Tenacibaculum dicentrarchi]MCD8443238.1 DUF1737 domain-containing protein [Tenacibaculum dicentrarchi]
MYKIISHHVPTIFEEGVMKSLKDGWSLQGGVSAYSHPIDGEEGTVRTTYCQAMIKIE